MGIMDTIFGGSSDVDYKQMDLWSPGQKRIFENLEALLGSGDLLQGNMGGPYGASLTALEQWAQTVFGGGAVTPAGEQAQTSLVDLMTMGPQNIDEYFTQTVENPLLESFTEDIRPAINRAYAPSGFWSSQRVSADQRASEDLLDALTRGRTEMAYQARESDLNRILQAAGVGTGTEQGTVGQLMQLGGMGNQLQQFQTQAMLSALGLRPFENIATVTPGSTGLLQSMLGPAMSGLGQGLGYGYGAQLFKPTPKIPELSIPETGRWRY